MGRWMSPVLTARTSARYTVGARRIDTRLAQVIAEVIRDMYLTKVRAKQEEAVRQVGLRCASERRDPPSRKAILTRVRALDTREVTKACLQSSEAASLVDSVPGTYRVDNALEVVQIDHTPVDVIAVDEAHRLPIGRPWLTLAIDVATVSSGVFTCRWRHPLPPQWPCA